MTEQRRAIDLVLPHLRSLDGYEAVDPPEVLAERAGIPASGIVKPDANENPYGPASKVAAAAAPPTETKPGAKPMAEKAPQAKFKDDKKPAADDAPKRQTESVE